VQQEDVEKAHGLGVDAHRLEGVEVHAAHLDVFDAALAQRVQRALAGVDHALGADGAVELVLDLQQAGGQLVVFAAQVAHAQAFVGRMRARQRTVQRIGITLQAVVADGQRRLRVALVAQPAHAQRGGVRQVQRAVAPSGCSSCSRPSTKLLHTAGLAPNSSSSRKEWRRKLRIRPKYSSLLSPGSDQL
jgi:hypothetical protein